MDGLFDLGDFGFDADLGSPFVLSLDGPERMGLAVAHDGLNNSDMYYKIDVDEPYEAIQQEKTARKKGGALVVQDTRAKQIEVDGFYWTALVPDIVNSGREEQGSVSV